MIQLRNVATLKMYELMLLHISLVSTILRSNYIHLKK